VSESTERAAILFELIAFAEFQAKRKFLAANPSASEIEIEEFLNHWYCDKSTPTLDCDTRLVKPLD
jgi:hypothetical protein